MQQPCNYLNCISKLATISLIYKVLSRVPKPYDVPCIYQCSDYKRGYDGTLINAWHVIWFGYIRLLPYKALEPVELSCYLSWCFYAINNDSSKCIDMICSHCPRHHHCKTSLLMHVIQCKIRVRPEYFIKQVRPG